MESHESETIVEMLIDTYGGFNPDEEAKDLWTAGFMVFKNFPVGWIKKQVMAVLIDDGGDYLPPLPKIINRVALIVAAEERRNRHTLAPPEEEPKADPEQNKANAARVADIVAGLVAKATPKEEDKSELYRRAVGRSSDDLTEEY